MFKQEKYFRIHEAKGSNMKKFNRHLLLMLLFLAGLIGGVALRAEGLEGWKISIVNVPGDDGDFVSFTICLLDNGTFNLPGFCEAGRWFDGDGRRWAQGGCTAANLSFALDGRTDAGNTIMTGFVSEFVADASFVVGAYYPAATRNDAACSSAQPSGGGSLTGR